MKQIESDGSCELNQSNQRLITYELRARRGDMDIIAEVFVEVQEASSVSSKQVYTLLE